MGLQNQTKSNQAYPKEWQRTQKLKLFPRILGLGWHCFGGGDGDDVFALYIVQCTYNASIELWPTGYGYI